MRLAPPLVRRRRRCSPTSARNVVKVVALHVSAVIATLPRVATQAKTLLQTAREAGDSFGLDYNYVDDDIARLLGRLRYMRLIAM